MTRAVSFGNITRWLRELRDHTSPDVVLALVGNKIDLCDADAPPAAPSTAGSAGTDAGVPGDAAESTDAPAPGGAGSGAGSGAGTGTAAHGTGRTREVSFAEGKALADEVRSLGSRVGVGGPRWGAGAECECVGR